MHFPIYTKGLAKNLFIVAVQFNCYFFLKNCTTHHVVV